MFFSTPAVCGGEAKWYNLYLPSFDSAYNKATDGDYIYLPGGVFSAPTINKKLNIVGAGHHPDSSSTTFPTVISNQLFLSSDASGGSIEGINFTFSYCGYYCLPTVTNGAGSITNFSFIRCKFASTISLGNSNCNFFENVFGAQISSGTSDYFEKNIFQALIGADNSTFKNNVFIASCPNCQYGNTFQNCILQNNVFCERVQGSNTFLNNNLRVGNIGFSVTSDINRIVVDSIAQIFVNYPNSAPSFSYDYDFHLKPTCPGNLAGNDGTDVGIYGTTSPTKEGWIPANPHIYFKKVNGNTSSDGKLKVSYKVRIN